MINYERADEIRLLRKQGTAIRAIARELHVDRGTVHRVLRGKLWPTRNATTRKINQIRQLVHIGVHELDIADIVGVHSSLVRRIHSETARDAHYADRRKRGVCPVCGHRVPLPCVACAAAAEKDPPARSDHRQDSKIFLGVDLLPEDYARYLEIRQNKIAEGDLSVFLGELLSQI